MYGLTDKAAKLLYMVQISNHNSFLGNEPFFVFIE